VAQGALFPTGVSACHNLVCLSPNAHLFWGKAYFALQPIELSEDPTRLTVRFFWLQFHDKSSEVTFIQRPTLPNDLGEGPNSAKLWNDDTENKIRSGDEFYITTDDPVERPLPSYALIEMQWFLHRVAAISGGAEPEDEDDEDSDDDDDLPMRVQRALDWGVEDMDVEEMPGLGQVPRPVPHGQENVESKHASATAEGQGVDIADQTAKNPEWVA
jgi:hypothetical protein